MHRRTLLASVGATIGSAVAGCLGRGGGQPEESDTPVSTDPPSDATPPTTPDETTSPPGSPTPSTPDTLSATFDVVDSGCGEGENAAAVTFGSETVEIEGTIRGSDTCDGAELGDVLHEDGELTVPVETVRPEGTPACSECITDIEYEAEIDPDGPLPDTVTVTHDGETVAAAER